MADPRKLKILVVEDDTDLLEMYRQTFGADPRFDGRYTHDGGHGAALLRGEAFDAAVIDVRLPTMNGLQVASVARASEHNRNLPIYIVSGLVSAETTARAEQLGVAKVIEKPIDLPALLDTIVHGIQPARKSSAYDARILNAILHAIGAVLAECFGEGSVKAGKPGVRKGRSSRSCEAAVLTLSCGMTSGTLALIADASFSQASAAVATKVDGSGDSAPKATTLVGVSSQIGMRLEQHLAEVHAATRVGKPASMAAGDSQRVHAESSPILFFPFHVSGASLELEVCLERKAEDITSGSDAAVLGSLVIES